MMRPLLKTVLIASFLSISALPAFAKDKKDTNAENIEIFSKAQAIKQDIAGAQVFSEICPQIIGKNKNFDESYKRYLGTLLPGISDPVLAVKILNDEEDYQLFLKQARQETANASREENREVCLDMIEWNKKK